MVRLSDEDGTEHVYELPLPEDVQELIRKAGPEMLSAITTAKETFLTMNVNPEVVGVEASQILTGLREKVVFLLMVYRKELLPLSKATVVGVELTLRRYFKNASFEQFKILLPALRKNLELRAKSAGVARHKFTFLAADMETLKVEGDKALKDVIPTLREALNSKTEEAKKSKKSARRADRLGKGVSFASITGGALLAKVLIIAAMPPLAPIVLSAGIAIAAKSKEEASSSVKKHEARRKSSAAACSLISNSLEIVKDIHTRAIQELAVCLQGCAEFFARIESQLGTLSPEDGDCESDAVLELIHHGLKTQAEEVIQACIEYGRFASKVETSIQVLDQFKPEKYGEKVEEWTKTTNKAIEEMEY